MFAPTGKYFNYCFERLLAELDYVDKQQQNRLAGYLKA
jgi:hypothetical protein